MLRRDLRSSANWRPSLVSQTGTGLSLVRELSAGGKRWPARCTSSSTQGNESGRQCGLELYPCRGGLKSLELRDLRTPPEIKSEFFIENAKRNRKFDEGAEKWTKPSAAKSKSLCKSRRRLPRSRKSAGKSWRMADEPRAALVTLPITSAPAALCLA